MAVMKNGLTPIKNDPSFTEFFTRFEPDGVGEGRAGHPISRHPIYLIGRIGKVSIWARRIQQNQPKGVNYFYKLEIFMIKILCNPSRNIVSLAGYLTRFIRKTENHEDWHS